MNTKRFGALVLSGLGLFLISGFAGNVFAQDSAGIRMQPAIIEDQVSPGQIFRTTLSVTNVGDTSKLFYLVSRDISGLSPNGTPMFLPAGEESDYSLSSWISFNTPSVTIAGGETKEIPVVVSVPRDADPGSHFAGLFVSLKPEKPDTIGTGVGYEVATIISLQVEGDVNEEARIRQFATGKMIYTKAEVDFKTIVENMGNVLVRARGPLEITDIFGKKVATLVVNDQGSVVLPDSSREFTTVWTGEGLTIGRYQAVLGLVYGNNGRKTITATTSFWVLPLNFILIVTAGLAALIVIFFTITHLYIRNKLSAMGADGKGAALRRGGMPSKSMFITVAVLIAVALLVVFMMVLFA